MPLLTGNTVYDSSSVGLSLSGADAGVSGNTAYGDADGISVSGSGSTVSGNTVFDNNSAGIAASGSVTVSDNTVYGQTGGAHRHLHHIRRRRDGERGLRQRHRHRRKLRRGGDRQPRLRQSGVGISAVLGSIAVQGNDVYGNGTGIDLGGYYTGTVSNNVLEGNTTAGIHDQASPYGGPQYLDNNTIVAEAGNGIQVDGGTATRSCSTTSSGRSRATTSRWLRTARSVSRATTISSTPPGRGWSPPGRGKTSSPNPTGSTSTGNDPHGQFANPQFVDESGPDGVTGFSTAPVGPPVVIDDSSASGFSDNGSWTQQTNGGYLGEYLTAAAGDNTATATWTFTGLTPGATYALAASWPAGGYLDAADAPFTVLDGSTVVGYRRVAQYVASSGIIDNGSAFQSLGDFVASGTTLTVMLSNNADATVEADAVLLQQIVGDHGADDDYQLLTASPAVDAGDPDSYYFQEPAPDGGRIDLGAFGDTHDATPSPAQIVQVLSPSGLEKYQVGQQVTIDWQTAGLTAMGPVALVDAGGAGVDNFGPDQFQTSAGSSDLSFTKAVDTSGVTDPAPQAVYQSYAQAAYGVGNALSYHLAVPNGTYTIRLDFVEPNQSVTAGGRVFDIDLQGATVQAGYDIVAAAGTAFKATAQTYTVTASGGSGINLSLVNDTATPAVLSGIEVYAANAGGVANPTVDLQVSPDGGTTWTTIASGLTMDTFGRGSYVWTIPRPRRRGTTT